MPPLETNTGQAPSPDVSSEIKFFSLNCLIASGNDFLDLPFITYKSYKESSIVSQKFKHGYFFPVFRNYVYGKLKSFIDINNRSPEQFDSFMQHLADLGTSSGFPVTFCLLIEVMIKEKFSNEILLDFDVETNGIQMYVELLKRFGKSNLPVIERHDIFKLYMNQIAQNGFKFENFDSYTMILKEYLPGFNELLPYIITMGMSKGSLHTLLKELPVVQNDWSAIATPVESFSLTPYKTIIRQIKFLDEINTSPVSDEVNHIKSTKFNNNDNTSNITSNISRNRIKCYICRKFGHTGIECPKYDPAKDKKRFDLVQYIELPADSKVIYTAEDDNTFEVPAEYIFHVTETPLVSEQILNVSETPIDSTLSLTDQDRLDIIDQYHNPTLPGSLVSVNVIKYNSQYGLTLTDHATGFITCGILNNKNDTCDQIITLLERFKNIIHIHGYKIMYLKINNDLFDDKIFNYCDSSDIIIETADYKSNCTIEQDIKIMMDNSTLPSHYWFHALFYSVYLNNSTSKTMNHPTPFEQVRKIKIKHKCLPVFGCLARTYNKQEGTFIGFDKSSTTIKLLLSNGTIIKSSNFKTFNNTFPYQQALIKPQNTNKSLDNDAIKPNYTPAAESSDAVILNTVLPPHSNKTFTKITTNSKDSMGTTSMREVDSSTCLTDNNYALETSNKYTAIEELSDQDDICSSAGNQPKLKNRPATRIIQSTIECDDSMQNNLSNVEHQSVTRRKEWNLKSNKGVNVLNKSLYPTKLNHDESLLLSKKENKCLKLNNHLNMDQILLTVFNKILNLLKNEVIFGTKEELQNLLKLGIHLFKNGGNVLHLELYKQLNKLKSKDDTCFKPRTSNDTINDITKVLNSEDIIKSLDLIDVINYVTLILTTNLPVKSLKNTEVYEFNIMKTQNIGKLNLSPKQTNVTESLSNKLNTIQNNLSTESMN